LAEKAVYKEGEKMKQSNPIFVVSDLHLGSGGRRDNFSSYCKEKQFFDFLDFIKKNAGELIITGDLVDLWRFGLRKTLRRYAELFDRLAEMNVSYIAGNHDQAVELLVQNRILPHSFFKKTTEPFTRLIGDKRFKFMHGHEFDPFNNGTRPLWGKIRCLSTSTIEWIKGTPVHTSDAIEEALIKLEAKLLEMWLWICLELKKTFNYDIRSRSFGGSRFKHLRTKKMLARHQNHKNSQGYDIAISAHTHKAGSFNNWYFNSGSWIGPANNFLSILPDGSTTIFDWTASGPKKNQTVLCV